MTFFVTNCILFVTWDQIKSHLVLLYLFLILEVIVKQELIYLLSRLYLHTWILYQQLTLLSFFLFYILNTAFVPTRNFPSSGSIPQIIAGAPSHLTVNLPVGEPPSNKPLTASKYSKALTAPSYPLLNTKSSMCSRCVFLPSFSNSFQLCVFLNKNFF